MKPETSPFARSLAGILLFSLVVCTVFAEQISGTSFNAQSVDLILLSPSWAHFFGTDSLGRDLFTRVFVGARSSLLIAAASSVLALFIGILIGTVSGWVGGRKDRWVLRVVDILQSIPSFLMVSLLCLFFQNSLVELDYQARNILSLGLAISLVHWFNVAKVARGLTKQIRAMAYIEASRALGAAPAQIIFRHVIPNMQSTLLVLFTLQIPTSILYESMITFAGYGLQSPQVSWGILLQEGWRTLAQFPHLLLLPALILFLTVLSFHLVVGRRA
jgi:ABC-type dipeptide/oligopeptide/nickel transport system permease subunit